MKITVKKGLNINIKGASEKIMGEANLLNFCYQTH